MASLQIELIRFQDLRRLMLELPALTGAQRHLQRLRHRLRVLAADSEDAFQIAIVALRPQMVAVCRVDELRSDAYLVARFGHTTFEHRADVQLRADIFDGFVLALASERRG